jgi:hypothetical protein
MGLIMPSDVDENVMPASRFSRATGSSGFICPLREISGGFRGSFHDGFSPKFSAFYFFYEATVRDTL